MKPDFSFPKGGLIKGGPLYLHIYIFFFFFFFFLLNLVMFNRHGVSILLLITYVCILLRIECNG